MTGSGVQEIVAGMWRWQHRPRGLRPGTFGTRTSYALTVDGETLLVDPLVATLDVEHVLVTHGQSALGDGTGMLRRALERDPWQRPKR
jgi:hypothetical protein